MDKAPLYAFQHRSKLESLILRELCLSEDKDLPSSRYINSSMISVTSQLLVTQEYSKTAEMGYKYPSEEEMREREEAAKVLAELQAIKEEEEREAEREREAAAEALAALRNQR